jgi:hypothetical protein
MLLEVLEARGINVPEGGSRNHCEEVASRSRRLVLYARTVYYLLVAEAFPPRRR